MRAWSPLGERSGCNASRTLVNWPRARKTISSERRGRGARSAGWSITSSAPVVMSSVPFAFTST
ncbi:MAG: hypothetical protein DWB46_05215 [Leptolyngbya sp.]|nr:hypothetical protein [Leptolyngbya sp.]